MFQDLGFLEEGLGKFDILDLPNILEAKTDKNLKNPQQIDDFELFYNAQESFDSEAELYDFDKATENYNSSLQHFNDQALTDCEQQLGIVSLDPESDSEQEFFDSQLKTAKDKKRHVQNEKLRIKQEFENSPEYLKQQREAIIRRTNTLIVPSQEAFMPRQKEDIHKIRQELVKREKDLQFLQFYQMV